jgi:glutamyl-tRNA synthetase
MLKSNPAMDKIRTRFAPSPTGSMHIGNLRTAFYAFALAKHSKGDFILRIENTDKKREKIGGIDEIKELLGKFNIKWDEYYVQSGRLDLYKKAAEELVKSGHAYEEEGAIRLKIDRDEKVSFVDFVLGKEVAWDTNTLEELVLLKSDGYPTYHLASVVDDHEMKISHVLRGHDWLPSTPIHLLIYKYLGYKVPEIGHLSDIMDPEGGKLSKRKGSTSVEGLLKEGYLPEALFNFVILLGWAPKDNRELFTLEEFVKYFDPKGFQKANPVFNRVKLDWFNGEYIRKLSVDDLNLKFRSQNTKFSELTETKQLAIAKLVQERITKITDFDNLAKFFWEEPMVDKNLLGNNYRQHLAKALEGIEKDMDLMEVVKANNFKTGDFFMDLRIAICGSKFTPPINESIAILGNDEAIKRIKAVI